MSTQRTARDSVPVNVVAICSIMVAGAVVALVLGSVQLLLKTGILQSSAGAYAAPLSVMDVNQALLFLIAAVLCLWVGWKNYQGWLWARNLTIVLGLLIVAAVATVFLTLISRLTVVACISYGVSAILSIIVLALVWRKDSNTFYEAHSRPEHAQNNERASALGTISSDTVSGDTTSSTEGP